MISLTNAIVVLAGTAWIDDVVNELTKVFSKMALALKVVNLNEGEHVTTMSARSIVGALWAPYV